MCRKVGLKRGREQTVDWHQKFRTALQRTVGNEIPKYREDKRKKCTVRQGHDRKETRESERLLIYIKTDNCVIILN